MDVVPPSAHGPDGLSVSGSAALEAIKERLSALSPKAYAELESAYIEQVETRPWVPNPGPQTEAYYCLADELFYGGSAGSGKTDLAVGLAYTAHQRSLVMREFNEDARSMGERLLEIAGGREGWNGQLLRYTEGDKLVEFAGLPAEKDKQRHKGIPHDLIVYDEIGDFHESQYLFVNAWNRSTKEGQRCRILCTGNPPTRAKGLWVIRRWAAWLDPKHPRPAKSGELRWYISDEDGVDTEVDGPGPHLVGDREVMAKSRCFIRGTLSDNPDLVQTNYSSTLDSLPKEMRDAYRDGKFDAALNDAPNQVIPTAWILEAQKRWTPKPPEGIPMCAIGADIAQGGKDNVVLAPRYDGWFDELVTAPGKDITDGPMAAALVIRHRKHSAVVVVDLGGGYGGDCYTHLKYNIGSEYLVGWKGAEKSVKRSKDGLRGFVNKRSAAIWALREALDPTQEGGSPIALPQDPELIADLTVLTWEPGPRGIAVMNKEDACKILGRSTDKGDAVVMSWAGGPTYVTHHRLWRADQRGVRGNQVAPVVDMGKRYAVRKRR